MNDDRIIKALRRRPSDEPAFERPLRLPADAREGAEPMSGLIPSLGLRRADGRRPEIRSRTPVRAAPALLLALVLIAVVAVLTIGGGWQAGPASPSSGSASPSGPARPSVAASGGIVTERPLQSGDLFVPPPVMTPHVEPTAMLYTVNKADTNLTFIAARYNVSVAAIVAYNHLMSPQYQIKNPNVIWSGMQFYIPPPGWTPPPAPTARPSN